ncbi:Phosphatase DCR2 [Yarrowia sp. B02]|nr:Phosphatase DCR2 [Yarrowia sp. B02]
MSLLPKRWLRLALQLALAIGFVWFVLEYFGMSQVAKQSTDTARALLYRYHKGQVITEVSVMRCLRVSSCSFPEGWEVVPKDLHLGDSWKYKSFLMVQKKAQKDLKKGDQTVLDIAFSEADGKVPQRVLDVLDLPAGPERLLQLRASGWQYIQDNMWAQFGDYGSKSVTGLTVLYGPDALRVHGSKFKIMQLADLHYSTGFGKCLQHVSSSTDPEGDCQADPLSLQHIEAFLDREKPDMVVLTGDQIYGSAAPDAETALLKVLDPLIRRKVPWAAVFGNHDDENTNMNRAQQMAYMETLPYSLSQAGPEDVDGVGNYWLQILAPKSDNPAVTLYFLDTHAKHPNQKLFPGYDWVRESQLAWLEDEHHKLKPLQNKYTHIHMSMAFFHIPTTEYRNARGKKMIGQWKEGAAAPKHNSGVRKLLEEIGVSVISVGHDHVNDFCMWDDVTAKKDEIPPMWLCYGGGLGEGGYGGYGGYVRRMRVFEIDTEANSITSWKRKVSDYDETFDKQTLVQGGAPYLEIKSEDV